MKDKIIKMKKTYIILKILIYYYKYRYLIKGTWDWMDLRVSRVRLLGQRGNVKTCGVMG